MYFRFYCIVLFIFCHVPAISQKYVTKAASVVFFSKAAVEDIKAENLRCTALFDSESGEIAIVIPIKEFQFAKALMQEHFNEKYLESDRFPKSTFQGTINGLDGRSDSVQHVTAKGKLTIHGVTRAVEIPGDVQRTADLLTMHSIFKVRLEDYKIKIPTILWQNIAEEIEVTVNLSLVPK
jgi:polyisoprenoid-binding protein YceI